MAAALPQDSGKKQSAEELESIAIFYRMRKTKLDYVRKESIKISNSIGYIFVLT